MGPAVNDRSMRVFEPLIIEQVNVFIRQVALSQGKPIDMRTRCNYLGMDIIGLLSFGFALQSQTQEKYRFLADEMAGGNRRLNVYMQIPTIPKYRLQVPLNLIWYKTREKVFRLIEFMIKSRMTEDQHAKHDFYSFVADSLKNGDSENLRVRDLWMEAILFIVAGLIYHVFVYLALVLRTIPGGDTTATATAATLFYVARHRECYKRLYNEIRSVFANGNDIGGSKLASCQYLRACIDESLRMSPPIPGTLWRQLSPDEQGSGPYAIDGHVIPKDTYVGVNTYALHHNQVGIYIK